MTNDNTPPSGVVARDVLVSMSGLEFLQAMVRKELPKAPIGVTLGFDLVQVDEGRAVFHALPGEAHLNPLGTVHAGYAATLLDSCMACAVQSTLPKGASYTTMEFKISLVRPVTPQTGEVTAEGQVLSRGRRAATAEGHLRDAQGRLLAHATTTCLLFDVDG